MIANKRGRISRVHVDQFAIKRNRKQGTQDPPISLKTSKGTHKANRVDLLDENGNVVASVIYSPEKPLSCGAHVWVESRLEARVS